MGKVPGQFGLWLRDELTQRGFNERGGATRFAREAGVDVSIVSRVLNEGRAPQIEALRSFGRVLGYTLGEMLVFAGVATADELPVRTSTGAPTPSAPNKTALLADAFGTLRESAALEGKSVGELLVERGLADEVELVIPAALPPDPLIVAIQESDLPEESKATVIRLHLENRARLFEEARLEREQKRKKPGT